MKDLSNQPDFGKEQVRTALLLAQVQVQVAV